MQLGCHFWILIGHFYRKRSYAKSLGTPNIVGVAPFKPIIAGE